ncbi:hypothetical protein PAECIP111893_04194 [Paenibacillus plantiphilus]|uniref:Zinc-ribbon domain-containing protein n=1 Tax=Paenibacillus plantiphilus TaxID=2905650 RepID=A0ABM9CNA4_9BACL|nr:hypothetical protein [Paenibacillus plantiphilus]CAH1216875.1 hypothetical protein PAECIP111893_04194 [Paenibacillus plantiphilus]
MATCQSCGAAIESDYRFCRGCGASLAPAPQGQLPPNPQGIQLDKSSQAPQSAEKAQPEISQPEIPRDAASQHAEPPTSSQPPKVQANTPAASQPATVQANAPAQPATIQPAPPASNGRPPAGTRGISRRNVLLLAAVVLLAGILYGAYEFGAYWTSKERLIDNFETALQDQDGKALAGLLASDDEKLVINEETISGYMKFMKENSTYVNKTIRALTKESFLLEDDWAAEGDENEVIHLRKSGKFLFYDQYELVVSPVFITISTNYKDAALTINGKEVAKSDKPDYSQRFGPYFPGIYKLEAKLKTDFVALEKQEEAIVMTAGEEFSASLYLDGQEVSFDTNTNGVSDLKGKLLINGKDTGINPFETQTFGPVTTDGAMKLAIEAEYPWGTMKTAEIPINGSHVEINLAENSPIQDEIVDAVVKYNKEELEAFTSGEVQKITQGTDNIKSSLQERIDYEKQQQSSYTGKYTGASIDMESFALTYDEGKWKVSVLTIAKYMSAYYYTADVVPDLGEDGQGRYFVLIYDEASKKWQVDVIQTFYDGYDMSDNMKEIEEKDPALFTSAWKPTVSAASSEISQLTIENFMVDYLSTSVRAINERNFDIVAPLMDPAGPVYNESYEYINYLETKGITEELVHASVDDVQAMEDSQSYKVTTSETYNISYSDGSVKTKSYKSVFQLVVIDSELRTYKLISTKEQ